MQSLPCRRVGHLLAALLGSALVLLLLSGRAHAEEASTVDTAVFEPLVEQYFDAMTRFDGDAIRAVFHPDAQLFGVFGGNAVTIPLEAWIERIENDPAPAPDAKRSPTPDDGVEWRILDVDRDGDIARVKVQDRFLEVWYTDYLTFRESEGRWQIVNKTFTYERR